jgi:hypothetical protein
MVRVFLISPVVLIVLAAAGARSAHAGACLSPEENDDAMTLVEKFAKDKKAEPGYEWMCVELDAVRLRPRIERACGAILARDGEKSPCLQIATAAGIPKLGTYDLWDLLVKQSDDPLLGVGTIGTTKSTFLARMGDPRAVAMIVEAWKAAIPRAEEREKRRGDMRGWSVWRQSSAQALGMIGGQDEIAFLEEQAKATKDIFVAQACRDGIAAIKKRLAAQAKAAAQAKPAAAPDKPAAPADKPAAPAAPAPPAKP